MRSGRQRAEGMRMLRSHPGSGPTRQTELQGRRSLLTATLAGATAVSGCGSLPSFFSSKTKIPDLPPIAGGGAIRQAWDAAFAGGPGFQPAAASGKAWVAAPSGAVALLDPRTGGADWRVDVGRPLVGGIGTNGQIGVVAARDGALIALGADGKQRWAAAVGAEVVTVPAVGYGLVVVRGSDNRVTAFDASSGGRRWSFQRQAPSLVLRQTGAITMDASQVYVGLPGGRMLAVATESGAQRWEAAVSIPRGSNEIERIADVAGVPVLSGNDLCAAAFQGRVACLDIGTGRTLWSRDLVSAAGVAVDERALAVCDEKGHVHLFSRGGSSLWRQEKLAGRGLSAPLLAPAHVLVGDSQGVVHLLRRDDGALLARIDLGRPLSGAAIRFDSIALVQTMGGALHALAFE